MRALLLSCAVVLTSVGGMALAETAVERGEYLVQGIAGCGNCHTPLGPNGPVWEQDLGGRLVEKNEGFTAIAPNITPGSHIADWSDAELARGLQVLHLKLEPKDRRKNYRYAIADCRGLMV